MRRATHVTTEPSPDPPGNSFGMHVLPHIALPSLLAAGLLLYIARRKERIPPAERRRILQEKAERWQQEFAEVSCQQHQLC
jgi:hypothetical protein